MFGFIRNPLIKAKANKIKFDENCFALSNETLEMYKELKVKYKNLHKDLERRKAKCKRASKSAREFLDIYLKLEAILVVLFNEIFQPHFTKSIEKKKTIFVLLNKICKIMLSADSLRSRNVKIFCEHTLEKMKRRDLKKLADEGTIDKRISILSAISLPMGRLLLCLF
ncbi:hypothetical protein ENBRE01_1867, partial [Enteropsectra breve]